MTLEEIKKRIEATKKPKKELSGQVTRKDILEVLNHHADPKKEKENVKKFLDSLDDVLDDEKKEKILNDLESYSVSYDRKKK